MSLMTGATRKASVVVLGDMVEVAEISIDALKLVIYKRPELVDELVAIMAERQTQLRPDYADMSTEEVAKSEAALKESIGAAAKEIIFAGEPPKDAEPKDAAPADIELEETAESEEEFNDAE